MIRSSLIAASLLFAGSAWSADCAVTIDGNDAMQFNMASIDVPASCTDFTVNLTHSGKLAKAVMGHNWVLSKTADYQAAATDGMSAGIDNDYVKPGDDRVIAHTTVIGGGESTSVTFPVSALSAGEAYTYYCSFPGHWAIMKGTLAVK